MKQLRPLSTDFPVSVLICTRNRFEAATKCVRTLVTQTLLPDELIVVDSSDVLGLEAQLHEVVGGVKMQFKYEHSAPGLTLQRNIGVSLSRGSVIIFLDDDTVLDREYVEKIVQVYADDKDGTVAGVQGSFIGEKKMSWLAIWFRQLFLLPGPTGLGRMQASGFPSYVDVPDRVIDVDVICGGNTGYRREVLDQFHWNEAFRGYSYMEDDDYSYRVSREFRLVQTPEAQLVHEASPAGRDGLAQRLRMEVRNHALFFKLNMPKTLRNLLAFAWSEIGCCLLSVRTYGLYAFVLRVRAYVDGLYGFGRGMR